MHGAHLWFVKNRYKKPSHNKFWPHEWVNGFSDDCTRQFYHSQSKSKSLIYFCPQIRLFIFLESGDFFGRALLYGYQLPPFFPFQTIFIVFLRAKYTEQDDDESKSKSIKDNQYLLFFTPYLLLTPFSYIILKQNLRIFALNFNYYFSSIYMKKHS